MTTEIRKDPRKQFTPRFWPWILAAVMLAVYGATLERWVSLLNMDYVAKVSGWTWQPEVYNPLLYLLTYPLRWLPAAQIPVALNLLAAVCGVLTLALLARTVAILPQDRTEAQRLRETSDFSFLTTRTNWLPPLLAVLVCGLQLTFWENATVFTGETVDLLVFAFTIWSLVEYRLDEREWRLLLAVFLYAADMTQNVGAIGFLPFLLGAIIWTRGLSFFNSNFLTRLTLCGLAGLSLYLLLPTLGLLSGKLTADLWWPALKFNLALEWRPLKLFFLVTDYRHDLGLISLTTLLPVVMLAFRWGAGFGDRSRLGTELTGLMVHLVYALMLMVCVWVAFDPPFSPRHLRNDFQTSSYLSFYYLAALSVGYYSGYFLLVFKVIFLKNDFRRPSAWKPWLQPAATAAIVALTILAPAGLVYKNLSIVRSVNSGLLQKYAETAAACLPRTGGVLLSDNETGGVDTPRRLFLVQAALVRAGREKEYVPVDTFALTTPQYHRYLHKQYADRWPLLVSATNNSSLPPRGLLGLMNLLSKTNAIYYLHPSYGYYFETFYLEPHGLVYHLKPLPADNLLPRLPDASLVAENDAFWAQTEAAAFDPIIRAVTPAGISEDYSTLAQQIMARLHVQPEPNYNAQLSCMYYSRALDFWGVELQRTGRLTNAASYFKAAELVYPQNLVAGINLDFNQKLQAREPVALDLAKTSPDQLGQYTSWNELVTANGPLDDPSFCYAEGWYYFQDGLFNESLASFSRVRELIPDYLPVLLSVGELYLIDHHPQLALAALREPLDHPARFSLNDDNSTELNILAATAYLQQTNLAAGVALIEKEIAHHPDNSDLLNNAAQVFLAQGLYTNALHAIKLKLALNPNDPGSLDNLGYAYMQMKDYPQAIASLTSVLRLQPTNNDALFNRAIALLSAGQLDAARSDYQQLQKAFPKSFQVAFGLGEIAWRQHATNDAIANYHLYLANAPTNTAEARLIGQRLAGLQGKSP